MTTPDVVVTLSSSSRPSAAAASVVTVIVATVGLDGIMMGPYLECVAGKTQKPFCLISIGRRRFFGII